MKRFKIYSIEEVLPFVSYNKIEGQKHVEKEYDGLKVKMDSDRYITFAKKGIRCAICGIEGKYFALEQHYKNNNSDRWHFNLYALDLNGNEILMTKDHIIPKSNKGKNHIDNYQTMCTICNVKKGITFSVVQ